MKTLETKRLILRDFCLSDVDDFYEYASVEGVGINAGWPRHESKDTSLQIAKEFVKEKNIYAIVYKENNKMIGTVGLHNVKENHIKAISQKEIGYVLNKDYWGKGIMTEAVKRVVNYAFFDLYIELLWCGHFVSNDRSRRVIEKIGFNFYKKGEFYASQLAKTFPEKTYLLKRDDYFLTHDRYSIFDESLESKMIKIQLNNSEVAKKLLDKEYNLQDILLYPEGIVLKIPFKMVSEVVKFLVENGFLIYSINAF